MTYRDIANLSRDTIFAARLGAGLASEASLKTSDYLVDAIMTYSASTSSTLTRDLCKAVMSPFASGGPVRIALPRMIGV